MNRNFAAFVWHSLFLALTLNMMDVNTVVPNLILESGGSALHLGLLTAILIGGTNVMQLVFAGVLMNRNRKKPYLILGITLRIAALALLGFFLLSSAQKAPGSAGGFRIAGILLIMAVFSFSGSFASISYMDILGRAVEPERRKRFFVIKQTASSIGVILSALAVRLVLGRFSYPANYSILFMTAAALLAVASLGFWAVREPAAPDAALRSRLTPGVFLRVFREDPNLRKYLLMVNTAGITMAFLPFLVSLAGVSFGLSGGQTGNYLLLQMTGALATNLILNTLPKSQKYRGILYYFVITGALLPPAALLLRHIPSVFPFLFLLSGSVLTAYQVAVPGILLEISDDRNRTVYTGISGAASLAGLIYPILAGFLITRIGYAPVFGITAGVILSGMLPASRIVCARLAEGPPA